MPLRFVPTGPVFAEEIKTSLYSIYRAWRKDRRKCKDRLLGGERNRKYWGGRGEHREAEKGKPVPSGE